MIVPNEALIVYVFARPLRDSAVRGTESGA